jgi:KDO2-lipid IV(A) lauroyltransferase
MAAKLAYYCLVIPLSYLPLRILYLFTDLLFLFLITLIPYRKKVIVQNLKRSFPEKSHVEINRLKRRFYKHFCDLLAEGIKNLTISKTNLTKRFIVKNPDVMDKLYNNQKSVILVSGHYNNWEWLITSQNFLFPHQAMGIGMPMTSKFWDKKINERRQRFGMKVIHSKNFKEEIQKNLHHPIAILTLGDQSPGDSRKSYWMEFLHQQTAVQFGTEQMANEFEFSVVFFAVSKVRRGYYEMELNLITDDPRSMNWGQITERQTKLLEKEILNHPEFWMWSHKRWKREIPENLEQLKEEQHAKFNLRFRNN